MTTDFHANWTTFFIHFPDGQPFHTALRKPDFGLVATRRACTIPPLCLASNAASPAEFYTKYNFIRTWPSRSLHCVLGVRDAFSITAQSFPAQPCRVYRGREHSLLVAHIASIAPSAPLTKLAHVPNPELPCPSICQSRALNPNLTFQAPSDPPTASECFRATYRTWRQWRQMMQSGGSPFCRGGSGGAGAEEERQAVARPESASVATSATAACCGGICLISSPLPAFPALSDVVLPYRYDPTSFPLDRAGSL